MPKRVLRIETPEWAEPLLGSHQYYGLYGGRSSGKSHYAAEDTIEAHVIDPHYATVCVREVQQSLQFSIKRLLEHKIEKLGVSDYFDIQDKVIKRRNGDGLIIFTGMQNHTADSIKSLESFDRVVAEEAQSLSQNSMDLLRPTMRKPGAKQWYIWNPNDPKDPVDNLFRGEHQPKSSVQVETNYLKNPWLTEESRNDAEDERMRDPEKYQWVWMGRYLQNSESRVFRNWKVEEFDTPPDAEFRFGADWGFASDPTALVRSFLVGRVLYIDYEAWQVGCEIVNTPDLFLTIPESEKWPIIADSARPETISHMRNNGFPRIMKAIKGPKSVEEGVEFLKNYDIVVHPRCPHVAEELTMYSYKVDKHTKLVLPVLEDRKNHTIDALRYSHEGERRFVKASKRDKPFYIPTKVTAFS